MEEELNTTQTFNELSVAHSRCAVFQGPSLIIEEEQDSSEDPDNRESTSESFRTTEMILKPGFLIDVKIGPDHWVIARVLEGDFNSNEPLVKVLVDRGNTFSTVHNIQVNSSKIHHFRFMTRGRSFLLEDSPNPKHIENHIHIFQSRMTSFLREGVDGIINRPSAYSLLQKIGEITIGTWSLAVLNSPSRSNSIINCYVSAIKCLFLCLRTQHELRRAIAYHWKEGTHLTQVLAALQLETNNLWVALDQLKQEKSFTDLFLSCSPRIPVHFQLWIRNQQVLIAKENGFMQKFEDILGVHEECKIAAEVASMSAVPVPMASEKSSVDSSVTSSKADYCFPIPFVNTWCSIAQNSIENEEEQLRATHAVCAYTQRLKEADLARCSWNETTLWLMQLRVFLSKSGNINWENMADTMHVQVISAVFQSVKIERKIKAISELQELLMKSKDRGKAVAKAFIDSNCISFLISQHKILTHAGPSIALIASVAPESSISIGKMLVAAGSGACKHEVEVNASREVLFHVFSKVHDESFYQSVLEEMLSIENPSDSAQFAINLVSKVIQPGPSQNISPFQEWAIKKFWEKLLIGKISTGSFIEVLSQWGKICYEVSSFAVRIVWDSITSSACKPFKSGALVIHQCLQNLSLVQVKIKNNIGTLNNEKQAAWAQAMGSLKEHLTKEGDPRDIVITSMKKEGFVSHEALKLLEKVCVFVLESGMTKEQLKDLWKSFVNPESLNEARSTSNPPENQKGLTEKSEKPADPSQANNAEEKSQAIASLEQLPFASSPFEEDERHGKNIESLAFLLSSKENTILGVEIEWIFHNILKPEKAILKFKVLTQVFLEYWKRVSNDEEILWSLFDKAPVSESLLFIVEKLVESSQKDPDGFFEKISQQIKMANEAKNEVLIEKLIILVKTHFFKMIPMHSTPHNQNQTSLHGNYLQSTRKYCIACSIRGKTHNFEWCKIEDVRKIASQILKCPTPNIELLVPKNENARSFKSSDKFDFVVAHDGSIFDSQTLDMLASVSIGSDSGIVGKHQVLKLLLEASEMSPKTRDNVSKFILKYPLSPEILKELVDAMEADQEKVVAQLASNTLYGTYCLFLINLAQQDRNLGPTLKGRTVELFNVFVQVLKRLTKGNQLKGKDEVEVVFQEEMKAVCPDVLDKKTIDENGEKISQVIMCISHLNSTSETFRAAIIDEVLCILNSLLDFKEEIAKEVTEHLAKIYQNHFLNDPELHLRWMEAPFFEDNTKKFISASSEKGMMDIFKCLIHQSIQLLDKEKTLQLLLLLFPLLIDIGVTESSEDISEILVILVSQGVSKCKEFPGQKIIEKASLLREKLEQVLNGEAKSSQNVASVVKMLRILSEYFPDLLQNTSLSGLSLQIIPDYILGMRVQKGLESPIVPTREALEEMYQLAKRLILIGRVEQENLANSVIQANSNAYWRTLKHKDFRLCHSKETRVLPAGLQNLGGTCYMNSLFQQLFFVSPFKMAVLECDLEHAPNKPQRKGDSHKMSEEGEAYEDILAEIRSIFSSLLFSQSSSISTKSFCMVFKEFTGEYLDPMEQKDAFEFFILFCDKLENNFKDYGLPNAVDACFSGELEHSLEPKGCSHVTKSFEKFIALTVEIKDTLEQSLKAFFAGELLDGDNAYHCQSCDKKMATSKGSRIKKLPNTLILVLKRFDYNLEYGRKFKINAQMRFPLDLDLSQYLATSPEGQAEGPNAIEQSTLESKYSLKGIILHRGSGEEGHYVSVVCNEGKKWLLFDDEKVSECSPATLLETAYGTQIPEKSAYMLFYSKKTQKEDNHLINFEKMPKDLIQKISIKNKRSHFKRVLCSSIHDEFVRRLALESHEEAAILADLSHFLIVQLRMINSSQAAESMARINDKMKDHGNLGKRILGQLIGAPELWEEYVDFNCPKDSNQIFSCFVSLVIKSCFNENSIGDSEHIPKEISEGLVEFILEKYDSTKDPLELDFYNKVLWKAIAEAKRRRFSWEGEMFQKLRNSRFFTRALVFLLRFIHKKTGNSFECSMPPIGPSSTMEEIPKSIFALKEPRKPGEEASKFSFFNEMSILPPLDCQNLLCLLVRYTEIFDYSFLVSQESSSMIIESLGESQTTCKAFRPCFYSPVESELIEDLCQHFDVLVKHLDPSFEVHVVKMSKLLFFFSKISEEHLESAMESCLKICKATIKKKATFYLTIISLFCRLLAGSGKSADVWEFIIKLATLVRSIQMQKPEKACYLISLLRKLITPKRPFLPRNEIPNQLHLNIRAIMSNFHQDQKDIRIELQIICDALQGKTGTSIGAKRLFAEMSRGENVDSSEESENDEEDLLKEDEDEMSMSSVEGHPARFM